MLFLSILVFSILILNSSVSRLFGVEQSFTIAYLPLYILFAIRILSGEHRMLVRKNIYAFILSFFGILIIVLRIPMSGGQIFFKTELQLMVTLGVLVIVYEYF